MRAALLLAIALSACDSGDRSGDIHVDPQDHVSFVVPAGFRLIRDRDAWVLVGEKDLSGFTIAIRSVARSGWSEDRDLDMVESATEQALRAYPDASLRGPTRLEDAPYPGFAFDVTFRPRSKKGAAYRRRHATLISTERVFHVVETWPATRSEKTRREFQRVLDSVREEG